MPYRDTGYRLGATAVSDASFGTVLWVTPTNALASDDVKTTAVLTGGLTSQYLVVTNFSLNIPKPSLILGILFRIEKGESGSGSTSDTRVRVVKNGVIGSTDRSAAGNWVSADTLVVYGAFQDRWGESWAEDDINASNFGVAIAALGSATTTANIDNVMARIIYRSLPINGQFGGVSQNFMSMNFG